MAVMRRKARRRDLHRPDPMRAATRGGSLMRANLSRGLSPRQALVARARIAAAIPGGGFQVLRNDRPNTVSGQRGGKPKPRTRR